MVSVVVNGVPYEGPPSKRPYEGPQLSLPDLSRVRPVPLDEGRVPNKFTAAYKTRKGHRVELDVVAEPGRTRVEQLRITATGDQGVLGVTIDDVSLQEFHRVATTMAAYLEGSGDGPGVRRAARTATRRRITADRLTAVLEAFDEGGVAAVKTLDDCGERQAYRLVKRAKAQVGR
jgi:hypothetical protein